MGELFDVVYDVTLLYDDVTGSGACLGDGGVRVRAGQHPAV